MILISPLADTHEVVELIAPARRGGVDYPAGHQFAVVYRHPKSVVVVSDAGMKLMLPPRLVRRVKAAPAEAVPGAAGLAALLAAGVVTTAATLGRG